MNDVALCIWNVKCVMWNVKCSAERLWCFDIICKGCIGREQQSVIGTTQINWFMHCYMCMLPSIENGNSINKESWQTVRSVVWLHIVYWVYALLLIKLRTGQLNWSAADAAACESQRQLLREAHREAAANVIVTQLPSTRPSGANGPGSTRKLNWMHEIALEFFDAHKTCFTARLTTDSAACGIVLGMWRIKCHFEILADFL